MMAAPTGSKTVRFSESAEVDYLDGAGVRRYPAGSVHTLRSDKADRWIRRGKAVLIDVQAKLPEMPIPQTSRDESPATAPATSTLEEIFDAAFENAGVAGGQDSSDSGQRTQHVTRRRGTRASSQAADNSD